MASSVKRCDPRRRKNRVTRWTATGTHQGDLMGLPATGNDIRVSGITIDTIEDGQLVETWTILSLFDLLQQLDATPELD